MADASYTALNVIRGAAELHDDTSADNEQTNADMLPALLHGRPALETSQVKGHETASQPKSGGDVAALQSILCSGVNVLLVFVPFALWSHTAGWNCAVVFVTNFFAIMPLAAVLGAATESLAEHTGETIGGLVNASFGNAVEMIITVDAIKRGLCSVVQANLIGSVLSNLLLVLGMAFVGAGWLRTDSTFNVAGASANCSLLMLAAIGVVLPTLFDMEQSQSLGDSLIISRLCAMLLALVYGFFLLFQLKTHKHHFIDDAGDGANSDTEESQPVLSPMSSTLLLLATTVVISLHSELLVGSIDTLSTDYGVPQAFIGLILLPIVGNAAEHLTAVVAAMKGQMDLALGVAVGSSTQVALLIVPFSILVGWVYDQPMQLNFGAFHSGVFLLAVFLVSSILQDGISNWLEGVMLLTTYVMIAIFSWFTPNSDN